MRSLLIFVVVAMPALALTPTVAIRNSTRPGADFQVGDRFEIVVTGAAKQAVSVRTMRQGRTDWGPAIGSTDWDGRWSTTGQFEAADFGGWREVWTVGGKVANPVIDFAVAAPCIPGGKGMSWSSGPNTASNCETATGMQSYVTPSSGDSFRTPDGRVIQGEVQSNMTPEEYWMDVMEAVIGRRDTEVPSKVAGKAGDLIVKMIGVNALTEAETRKVLMIVHEAYEPGRFHAPVSAKLGMLNLLAHLADEAKQESLKQEIAKTISFVEVQ